MNEQLWSVVIGGAIGIAGSVGSLGFNNWLTDRSRRRSIAKAFQGEIGAILDIVRRRQYLRDLDWLISESGNQNMPIKFSVLIAQSYFRVYETNTKHLGLLRGDLPRQIARFYTYAKSLIEDVGITDSTQPAHVSSLERLTETRDILRELLEIGERLATQLNSSR